MPAVFQMLLDVPVGGATEVDLAVGGCKSGFSGDGKRFTLRACRVVVGAAVNTHAVDARMYARVAVSPAGLALEGHLVVGLDGRHAAHEVGELRSLSGLVEVRYVIARRHAVDGALAQQLSLPGHGARVGVLSLLLLGSLVQVGCRQLLRFVLG